MSISYQKTMNSKQVEVFISNMEETKWEPFVVEGMELGQAHVLRTDIETGTVSGLWKHSPEEHPDGMPFLIHGNETFYVLQGSAELYTPDGEVIQLKKGDMFSGSDGFSATWKTTAPFIKFYTISSAN
ncbi:cupin domain-containing protein [Bacillus subtilis]|uniref:cupin domain-containing protein n=1 Tax=Bacillus subtilis TaxID=1423 RepID=UPI0006A86D6E|nr:cupin domain-containing protein [Bacillus subtilis]OOE19978.1 hypothetical protein BSR82_06375 [Bacillus subtilis]CUB17980.1 hypothetical protein BN2127_JRS1_06007 [Bacillus cereus]CUB36618.1 hypothetical protein BN2127_JRS7_00968 [Bacillus subtilis]